MRNRRAVLEGLTKILDAGAPEELFVGPDDEAVFLYDLLVEAARARSSTYYWEICRTARRHRVTPAYVVDRAAVLLAAIEERRRTDLYRILGVPPLASSEVIRQRWLEVAKRQHPDVGGDGAVFRHTKQAYEVLRDAERRAEYERFWLRAHGPFERVAAGDDLPMLGTVRVTLRAEPNVTPATPPAPPPADETPAPLAAATPPAAAPLAAAAPPAAADPLQDTLEAAARLLGAGATANGGGAGMVAGLLARVEAALAPVPRGDLERLAAEVARIVGELEAIRGQLDALADLKRRVEA